MAIVIHIIDGSQDPNRQKQETHAGLMLSRDEELGWRAKLTAMPSQRELLRCVSDCPLATAENILLWSKRWGWKIKLHPNSVSLKQLMQEVKSYTPAGNPEVVILAAAMLLKNFTPRDMQKQPGLPNFAGLLQRLQDQAQQQQQQQQPVQQQPVQQKTTTQEKVPLDKVPDDVKLELQKKKQKAAVRAQSRQWVGDGADKMMRTQQRYEQHMAIVNQTVQA